MRDTRLEHALRTAVAHLQGLRTPEGCWRGRLSSSALSTATAVSALALAGVPEDAALRDGGCTWLARTQNADGGWGDTHDSPSNLATTLLAVSALKLAGREDAALARAGYCLVGQGADSPEAVAVAVTRAYGEDRTFAVPILMNCALAEIAPWAAIPGLPFELAVLPRALFPVFNLRVVSYALPALIAIGLLLEEHTPSHGLVRIMRRWTAGPAESVLARLQPESGGFLEATPLTAFVTMSLIARGRGSHPVARRGLDFLRASVRADGSWPIDTDLSVWLTTGAVTALTSAGVPVAEETRQWVRARQTVRTHPYTGAAPGGWAWTDLSGGVPDADDTAGALVALAGVGDRTGREAGARWLLDLQNADGGWPTFCRGWGRLPFDRSSPDITAHSLRALHPASADPEVKLALARGFAFLTASQRTDGAWVPLWFGNQAAPRGENPVLGTARVLRAYEPLGSVRPEMRRGLTFLIAAQGADGGWGGAPGVPATVEETALSVSALAGWRQFPGADDAVRRGIRYLIRRVEDGTWTQPAPIGLYFASLWYAEDLYPVIWTVEALGRVI